MCMSIRYIIFVIDKPLNPATPKEMRSIDAFNEKLRAEGAWVTAAGIEGSSRSYLVDGRLNEATSKAGSIIEGLENYSGFWIIESGSDEQALELAKEASRACQRRVELRPFLR